MILEKFAGPGSRLILFIKIFVLIIFGYLANQKSTNNEYKASKTEELDLCQRRQY